MPKLRSRGRAFRCPPGVEVLAYGGKLPMRVGSDKRSRTPPRDPGWLAHAQQPQLTQVLAVQVWPRCLVYDWQAAHGFAPLLILVGAG